MIRVRNGTRNDGSCACYNCENATVMRANSECQERVFCYIIRKFIPFKVVECSDHREKNLPNLTDMREQAWIIHNSRSGRRIGFLSPEDAEEKLGDYDIPGEYD